MGYNLHINVGYVGEITHLQTIDPNFQRDIHIYTPTIPASPLQKLHIHPFPPSDTAMTPKISSKPTKRAILLNSCLKGIFEAQHQPSALPTSTFSPTNINLQPNEWYILLYIYIFCKL